MQDPACKCREAEERECRYMCMNVKRRGGEEGAGRCKLVKGEGGFSVQEQRKAGVREISQAFCDPSS